MAVVALSTHDIVGIDIETDAATSVDDMEGILHPSERTALAAADDVAEFIRHVWSRKEAVLKAFGVGLSCSPRQCAVGPRSAAWQAAAVGRLGWAQVRSIDNPLGAALAVAVIGVRAPKLALFSS